MSCKVRHAKRAVVYVCMLRQPCSRDVIFIATWQLAADVLSVYNYKLITSSMLGLKRDRQ